MIQINLILIETEIGLLLFFMDSVSFVNKILSIV